MELPWARKIPVAMPIWQWAKRQSLVLSNPDYGGDIGTTFLIFGHKVSLNVICDNPDYHKLIFCRYIAEAWW